MSGVQWHKVTEEPTHQGVLPPNVCKFMEYWHCVFYWYWPENDDVLFWETWVYMARWSLIVSTERHTQMRHCATAMRITMRIIVTCTERQGNWGIQPPGGALSHIHVNWYIEGCAHRWCYSLYIRVWLSAHWHNVICVLDMMWEQVEPTMGLLRDLLIVVSLWWCTLIIWVYEGFTQLGVVSL